MPTVLVSGRFRVVVFPRNHLPAHVHVPVPDGAARIALGMDESGVRLLTAAGMSAKELRTALGLVVTHRELLLREWSRLHG